MQVNYTPSGTRARILEAVRVEMARRQVNQVRLAEMTGLRQQYISRRMTGDVPWNTDDLDLIANALGVTLADLIPATAPAESAA